jgi:hypothetical protein
MHESILTGLFYMIDGISLPIEKNGAVSKNEIKNLRYMVVRNHCSTCLESQNSLDKIIR